MKLETGKYYHIYNRSNDHEVIFREEQQYNLFLKRYKTYTGNYFETLAYCLMPTHFHFLVKVVTADIESLKNHFAALLCGYTKSVNKSYGRTGSLFQTHSKAKEIDDERYLLTMMSYIHQNPLRAGLVKQIDEWNYSSYCELAGLRDNYLADHSFLRQQFPTAEEFKKYSEELVTLIKYKYWI